MTLSMLQPSLPTTTTKTTTKTRTRRTLRSPPPTTASTSTSTMTIPTTLFNLVVPSNHTHDLSKYHTTTIDDGQYDDADDINVNVNISNNNNNKSNMFRKKRVSFAMEQNQFCEYDNNNNHHHDDVIANEHNNDNDRVSDASWYSKSELKSFRSQARDKFFTSMKNNQTKNDDHHRHPQQKQQQQQQQQQQQGQIHNTNSSSSSILRGLEVFMPHRQKYRFMAIRCTLSAQRQGVTPEHLASVAKTCTSWSEEVALLQACHDYATVYQPSLVEYIPAVTNRPPKFPFSIKNKKRTPMTTMTTTTTTSNAGTKLLRDNHNKRRRTQVSMTRV